MSYILGPKIRYVCVCMCINSNFIIVLFSIIYSYIFALSVSEGAILKCPHTSSKDLFAFLFCLFSSSFRAPFSSFVK